MQRIAGLAAFVLLAGIVGAMADPGPTAGSLAKTNFTGHYELAGFPSDRLFSLDVTQSGSKGDVSFSAAMADGSGAAPEGTARVRSIRPESWSSSSPTASATPA